MLHIPHHHSPSTPGQLLIASEAGQGPSDFGRLLLARISPAKTSGSLLQLHESAGYGDATPFLLYLGDWVCHLGRPLTNGFVGPRRLA